MANGAWCWKPKRWTWHNWQAFMKHQHWGGYDLDNKFKAQVHRAGILAYIAELAFAVLIFVVFV